MKKVDIFVRVLQKPPAKHGSAIVIYRYKNNYKELYFSSLGSTQNKSIIFSSVVAIEGLKASCKINLYTQNNFGFKFMSNQKKWVNRFEGNILLKAIEIGGHEINFIDCSSMDSTKIYQNTLAAKLKKFK